MKALKKIISLFMVTAMLLTGVACADNGSGDGGQTPPGHTCSYTSVKYNGEKHWKECSCGNASEIENHTIVDGVCSCGYSISNPNPNPTPTPTPTPTPNPNPGDTQQGATVKKINAQILDGKVANLLGAEGFGIIDKSSVPATASNQPFSAQKFDSVNSNQKKTELVKVTEEGREDIYFHSLGNGVQKTFKHLNKKYEKHHHNAVQCTKTECNDISDEIRQEELNGGADTVLSLDARVNKFYNVGKFTFVAISSAVEGQINVLTQSTMAPYQGFTEQSGFPTTVNVIDNNLGGYYFSWIEFNGADGNKGMIPIKVRDNEENYHKINYWSDDYNQSYIIDNTTGLTYSLSQFNYIFSVAGGIIKIYDKSVAGNFLYYRPEVTSNGMVFEKIEVPTDEGFISQVSRCKLQADIYGNIVFASQEQNYSAQMDTYGEVKYSKNVIIAQKNRMIYEQLRGERKEVFAKNYLKANVYHTGSDGRLYRVNFLGDINKLSVSVLNANGDWASVEKNVSVNFNGAYVVWQVGEFMRGWDSLKLTCIMDGYAYFSTAVATDVGGAVFDQAVFSSVEQFTGVMKFPVDGFADGDTTVSDYIAKFKQEGALANGTYNMVLVGNTQMLYLTPDKVVLRDVVTGQEKSFSADTSNRGPSGNANFLIKGVGYINIEKELDFDSFGVTSFSSSPVPMRAEFEEYYKLIRDMK